MATPTQLVRSTPQVLPPVPATGLIGAEQALFGGLQGGLDAIDKASRLAQGRLSGAERGIQDEVSRGIGMFNPFVTGGTGAVDLQSALLGAAGPEAQQQAIANFQQSPGQQFLQKQQEDALLRTAAARGGLGGGNLMTALQEQAFGRANTAFNDRIAQLGSLGQLGLSAAGTSADVGLRGAEAGAEVASRAASMLSDAGARRADLFAGTGRDLAGGRTLAGQQLEGIVSDTTSGLANLQNQQGAGVSDRITGAAGDVSNLIGTSGRTQADIMQQIANAIAASNQGAASTFAGASRLPGLTPNKGILGDIGSFAGGIGSLLRNI